jgi:hypothetical protein
MSCNARRLSRFEFEFVADDVAKGVVVGDVKSTVVGREVEVVR